jgi:ABC-type microcin C transport system permease subunit YejE
MVECLAFAVFMNLIGFWITGVAGLFAFIWTLKGDKKINLVACLPDFLHCCAVKHLLFWIYQGL